MKNLRPFPEPSESVSISGESAMLIQIGTSVPESSNDDKNSSADTSVDQPDLPNDPLVTSWQEPDRKGCRDRLDDQDVFLMGEIFIGNTSQSSDEDESLKRSKRRKRPEPGCTLYDHKIREDCSQMRPSGCQGRHL